MAEISQISTTSTLTEAKSAISTATATEAEEKFSAALTKAMHREATFVSGRIGLNLSADGVPSQVVYFSETGEKLTTSTFSAESILRKTQKFGIDLKDLQGLGEQLDAQSIGYRPYHLYGGTGSDHGIDFDDLIAGGLGTAYDWTKDANVASKGPWAKEHLAASQALAKELGLKKNSAVTTEKGIDSAYFAPQATRNGEVLSYVSFNGSVASWHPTAAAAANTATLYGGSSYALHALATRAATLPDSTATQSVAAQMRDATTPWMNSQSTRTGQDQSLEEFLNTLENPGQQTA
ncbi:hypothetical protein MASR1M90_01400 [Desulfovibrionales bacterium]